MTSYLTTPSSFAYVSLAAQAGNACNTSFAGCGANADAQGSATASITFPNGIVVKPGVTLGT